MSIKEKISKVLRWKNMFFAQFQLGKIVSRKKNVTNGSVLIIKLDAIGDFIIWLDSAKEYRNLYPNKKLVLLCNEICVEIAKSEKNFDEIISLNIKQFESNRKYRNEKLKELEGLEFEMLIQAVYSRTVYMDILAAHITAGRKIAFKADETRTNLSRYMITRANKRRLDAIYEQLIETQYGTMMEIRRNGEMICNLGMKNFQTARPILHRQIIRSEIILPDSYFVIFPGSSTTKKMWDIANFAEIIDYVYEKTGWKVCLCGGKNEEYLFDKLSQTLKTKVVVYNYFGKTTLLELAEVIRKASMVISNDTSGIHFSAAVNTPAICIMGEYDYGRFLPYDYDIKENDEAQMIVCSANMICRHCAKDKMTTECKKYLARTGRYMCIDRVDVSQVKMAVDDILSKRVEELE